jgi:uncharacterized delta-60 repeat protein
LARLLPNGNLDTGFGPVTITYGQSFASLADMDYSPVDGRITICGFFTSVNGFLRHGIARLENDGTLDTSFNPFITNGGTSIASIINSISLQPDGKTIIAGYFDAVGGVPRNGFARLNADGSRDDGMDLTPSPLGLAPSIALQANGQILVKTTRDGPSGSGFINGIERFNADGAADGSFSHLDLGDPTCVGIQADGRVLAAGELRLPAGGGHWGMARLQNNPAQGEIVVLSSNTVAWYRGGSAPEAQHVSFDLSTDGCRTWTLLGHGTWTPDRSWVLSDLSLPASGHIRARARIPVSFCNFEGVVGLGSGSGLVEEVAAFRTPIDFTLARWLTQNYNVPFNISPGMLARDIDGDSLSDFREMAFGTHPIDVLSGISRLSFGTGPNGIYLISAGQPSFQVQSIEGSLQSQGQYLRRTEALAEGNFYYPEFSRNLVDWFSASPAVETATTVGGGYELIQVSPPADMPAGNALFFRIGLRFRP